MREKFLPKVGDKLYLHQMTNNSYVNDVRKPYTVRWVSKDAVGIQATLKWSNAKKWGGAWVHKEYPGDTYPLIAEFGKWDYYPYLD